MIKNVKSKEAWEVIVIDFKNPNNRAFVKYKWISEIKRNRVFCARLVACNYSQVPGVDFNKSFALVINNVSFWILLIAKLV